MCTGAWRLFPQGLKQADPLRTEVDVGARGGGGRTQHGERREEEGGAEEEEEEGGLQTLRTERVRLTLLWITSFFPQMRELRPREGKGLRRVHVDTGEK